MMHPHTRLGFVSEEIGFGVFATQSIPKGTVVWVLDELDRQLDKSEIDALTKIQQQRIWKYVFRDTAFIDSNNKYILASDIDQFMNHSNEANCVTTPYEVLFAAKDIYPGEELTDDYRWCGVDYDFEYISEDGRSKKVKADDIFDCHKKLQRKAEEAIQHFDRVEQPLKPLIKKKYLGKLNAIVEGREKLDSILDCYLKNTQKFVLK